MAHVDELLTAGEVASMLRVKPRTLQAWRYRGQPALPYVRLSLRDVRYRRDAVLRFLLEREQTSTAQEHALSTKRP